MPSSESMTSPRTARATTPTPAPGLEDERDLREEDDALIAAELDAIAEKAEEEESEPAAEREPDDASEEDAQGLDAGAAAVGAAAAPAAVAGDVSRSRAPSITARRLRAVARPRRAG